MTQGQILLKETSAVSVISTMRVTEKISGYIPWVIEFLVDYEAGYIMVIEYGLYDF